MRDICVIDVETTGVVPQMHEIIEIAAVRLWQNLDVADYWTSKVIPIHPERIEPSAVAINGYTPQEWEDSPRLDDVLSILETFVAGRRIGGHNVSFDLDFLRFWCHPCPPEIKSLYAPLDTATLAYPLYRLGILPDLHLATLAAHYCVENVAPHRALGDALCTAGVLAAHLRQWDEARDVAIAEVGHG
jgi:DNA polymerase-3 subunit epsilon